MNLIRERAKEYFPSVLLTLLSIVQAIALELLWGHIQETEYLHSWTSGSLIAWLQILTTLAGIILVWVAYASNALRFRWVPSTGDSVYPFIIGLLEFLQIAMLGPNYYGQWAVIMGTIFGIMVLVSHFIMRRARLNGDNGDFFKNSSPATIKDFYPHMLIVSLLIIGGLVLWYLGNQGVLVWVLVLLSLSLLIWQYVSATKFWNSSVAEE